MGIFQICVLVKKSCHMKSILHVLFLSNRWPLPAEFASTTSLLVFIVRWWHFFLLKKIDTLKSEIPWTPNTSQPGRLWSLLLWSLLFSLQSRISLYLHPKFSVNSSIHLSFLLIYLLTYLSFPSRTGLYPNFSPFSLTILLSVSLMDSYSSPNF